MRRSGVARGRATEPTAHRACTSGCRIRATRPSRYSRWSIPCGLRLTACDGAAAGWGSGGGATGVVREFEALAPMDASLLSERRRHAPSGVGGGGGGAPGRTLVNGAPLPPKLSTRLAAGDVVRIETPGGGGWGQPEPGGGR